MDKPKYKLNDVVRFTINVGGEPIIKEGKVFIVDANGTFFQKDEPSYDVMVFEPNKENVLEEVLYKHVRESLIV